MCGKDKWLSDLRGICAFNQYRQICVLTGLFNITTLSLTSGAITQKSSKKHSANRKDCKGFDKELIKELIKVGILVSLSLLALTKDKEEDELTIKIRMNSYALSFLFGVIFIFYKHL